jgi:hypothetical protein
LSLTIRDFVDFVAPDLIKPDSQIGCPIWPADVFAICCSILDRSGALRSLGTDFLSEHNNARERRIEEAKQLATQWRLSAGRLVPLDAIVDLWDEAIVSNGYLEIAALGSIDFRHQQAHKTACEALVKLCTIADEVFAGVGINPARAFPIEDLQQLNDDQQAEEDFWRITGNLLMGLGRVSDSPDLGATLCMDLPPQRLRVLPKAQPPTNGLSTRSLTTYLSLCPTTDVPIHWFQYYSVANDRKCNLLLVPWPFEVRPSQFVNCDMDGANRSIGWFGYTPEGDVDAPTNKVKELLDKALKEVGSVDAVILPETSVTLDQYETLRSYLCGRGIPVIAGVCEPGKVDSIDELQRLGKNYAAYGFPSKGDWGQQTMFFQHKHHRWKINSSQIETYSIATQLDPQKIWWEGISLTERSLNFFVLRDWLCSCVLICEDLARLDPAGQFVRAVAPDLVVALLFDGPQIPTRWPAYHATVLTDDPGSSVLTLSCLGMTQLSRPRDQQQNTMIGRTVGMWRDPRKGHVPIQIPIGREAALLTITRCPSHCQTADGRSNSQVQGSPVFSGLYYL